MLQTLLPTKQDVELDLSLDVQTQTHTTINIVPQFTVVCFRCLNIDGMGGGLALPPLLRPGIHTCFGQKLPTPRSDGSDLLSRLLYLVQLSIWKNSQSAFS